MKMRRLSVAALSIALATASPATSRAQAPAQSPSAAQPDNDALLQAYKQSISDASHGHYLDASYGLLKTLGAATPEAIHDPDVFDQWSQVMSTMTGMPTFNLAKGADFKVPAAEIAELRSATGAPAIREIVARARKTRIVILDENHLDPRGRAFGLEVARALRPLGYTVLAAEALRPCADDGEERRRMAQLATDGYARAAGDFYSGYYLDDPVFADFIRQSLALGYRPVSYETAGRDETNAQREQSQADNLLHRAVRAFPKAKILVYVGEHHLAERPIESEDKPYPKVAELLKRMTGIDPLTIDQAGLSPIPMNRPDADLHAIAAARAAHGSVVLMRHGRPFTTGLLAGAVDLQVVHPPVRLVDGRPDWMPGMGRVATPVPRALLPSSGTRLVQAFPANAAADARPIDQILVEAGKPAPSLMLPQGAVRYGVQDWPGGTPAAR
jgi:hypothetical protein